MLTYKVGILCSHQLVSNYGAMLKDAQKMLPSTNPCVGKASGEAATCAALGVNATGDAPWTRSTAKAWCLPRSRMQRIKQRTLGATEGLGPV